MVNRNVRKLNPAHIREELERVFSHIKSDDGDLTEAWFQLWKKSQVCIDARLARSNALAKERAAEDQCKETNSRLILGRRTNFGALEEVLFHARRQVARILGSLGSVTFQGRHGPGASVGLSGTATSAAFKYDARPTGTASLIPHLWRFSQGGGESLEWILKAQRVPSRNQMSLVPKDASTYRPIAKEPSLNLWCQLGVGDYMVERLRRRTGIDLRNQGHNGMFAAAASVWSYGICDRPVTIDLASASDTISYELVYELLPGDWFQLLDDLRCAETALPDGTTRVNAKFSSMGNGFTFPLETIVFYALCRAALIVNGNDDGRILVYGDDIIVPFSDALYVTEVLQLCGFTVNVEKSHYHGTYYESCGVHADSGRDVTPLRFKGDLKTPGDLAWLHNELVYRWVPRFGHKVWPLIDRIRELAEPYNLLYIPFMADLPPRGALSFLVRNRSIHREFVRPPLVNSRGGLMVRGPLFRVRWQPDLQRFEAKVAIERPVYASHSHLAAYLASLNGEYTIPDIFLGTKKSPGEPGVSYQNSLVGSALRSTVLRHQWVPIT